MLMVSSYLPELLGVCDRIAVMCAAFSGRRGRWHRWIEQIMLEATGG